MRGYPHTNFYGRGSNMARIAVEDVIFLPGLIRNYTFERVSGSTVYDDAFVGNATITNMSIIPGLGGLVALGGDVSSMTRNLDLGSDVTFASFSLFLRRLDMTKYGGVLFNQSGTRTVQIRPASEGNRIAVYNGSWVNSGLVCADTNWHHLGGVLESANNLRLYLDGVPDTSTVPINSSVVRYFGRPSTISGQEACTLGRIRVYSYILLSTDIMRLFESDRHLI